DFDGDQDKKCHNDCGLKIIENTNLVLHLCAYVRLKKTTNEKQLINKIITKPSCFVIYVAQFDCKSHL
ncbi:hypothetical protein O5172_24580, partial [Escherichia coli]|nr:hypothetical protein [Escherichia coli]